MFWYPLLAVLAVLFVLSVSLPVPRRVWAFAIYSAKYFWLWVADVSGVRKLFAKGDSYQRLTRPMLLRMWCEHGPHFIKFGQIIASSAGMFPDPYVKEFQKVLDRVKPFPFADVKRTLDEELGTEKAAHLIEVEPKQLASASIAQVHSAKLRDGTLVVIKVQRPGIIGRCMADMKLMRMLAKVVQRFKKNAELANPVGVVDDFTKTLTEELDFRKEAENLDRFNEIMRELGHQNIRSPVPHHEYTTRKILVMERFAGLRVDRFDEIRERGIDGEGKLVAGLRAWFQCVVFYGFFHGDVHAGNLMLLDDEDIGFLDFGIVGRFSDDQRWQVIDYMISFSTGNYRQLAKVMTDMTDLPPNLDMDKFVGDLKDTYGPLLTLSFGVNYAEFLPASSARDPSPMRAARVHPDTNQLLYFDRYSNSLAPKLTCSRSSLGSHDVRHPEARPADAKRTPPPSLTNRLSSCRARGSLAARHRLCTQEHRQVCELLGIERLERDADLIAHADRRAPHDPAGDPQRLGLGVLVEDQRDIDHDLRAVGHRLRHVRAQAAARHVRGPPGDRRGGVRRTRWRQRHRRFVRVARVFAVRPTHVPKLWAPCRSLASFHVEQACRTASETRTGLTGSRTAHGPRLRSSSSPNQPSVSASSSARASSTRSPRRGWRTAASASRRHVK